MIHPLTLSILYSPDGFISDGIFYVIACVVCLLVLALIIAVTICCVCHKKREEWDLTETTDYMGGNRTNGTINSGTGSNGEVVGETTTEEQSDFDFDGLAESVEMKVHKNSLLHQVVYLSILLVYLSILLAHLSILLVYLSILLAHSSILLVYLSILLIYISTVLSLSYISTVYPQYTTGISQYTTSIYAPFTGMC